MLPILQVFGRQENKEKSEEMEAKKARSRLTSYFLSFSFDAFFWARFRRAPR